MKHHITETHEQNFEIHNIVLSSQSIWVSFTIFPGDSRLSPVVAPAAKSTSHAEWFGLDVTLSKSDGKKLRGVGGGAHPHTSTNCETSPWTVPIC